MHKKHLGINLTTAVKDLCLKKYKTMKKETEDTNKWKYVHVHGWEESASLKCPYYPKQSIHSAQFLSRLQ